MSSLLSKFYELYRSILNGLEEVKSSDNKERSVLEASNSYLNKITQMRQEIGQSIKESVKENFFYVMIGAYDWIMIQYLSKNLGMSSSFFDPHSLEVRCYKSARFGDKFFSDAQESLSKYVDQKELLKVYLNVLNLLFHKSSKAADNLARQLTQVIYGGLEYKKTDPCACENAVNRNGRIFNVNRATIVVVFLSATYCVTSSLLWLRSTHQLRDKLQLVQLAKV